MTDWKSQIDTDRSGVWRYAGLLDVPPQSLCSRVDVGDGPPIVRTFTDSDEFEYLAIQREDLNPNGSHKDRSLSLQVSWYLGRGAQTLCLSSSGNAAIAAAAACRIARLRLVAFASPDTPANKLEIIRRFGAIVVRSERAIGLCREFSRAADVPNIRPSVDDTALWGYQTLAFAHAEFDPNVDSVFCYTTSGSTLVGLSRGFDRLAELGWAAAPPALHAAQAGLAAGVAAAFGETVSDAPARSVVGDLGAKRTRRHGELVRAIRATSGHAWALSDREILAAREFLLDRGIHVGLESACAMAAARKAAQQGRVRRPLVLVTGHYGHELANHELAAHELAAHELANHELAAHPPAQSDSGAPNIVDANDLDTLIPALRRAGYVFEP